jgi:hypothetical protein
MAAHPKLYGRTGDESMLDEVKRIMISGSMPICRWAGQKSADHICIDKICFQYKRTRGGRWASSRLPRYNRELYGANGG